MYNGLNLGLGNLPLLSKAKSRSITPENFTGEKGKGGMATEGTGVKPARDLGQGWKISPSVKIKPNETFTVAEINESGAIQHIWMTPTGVYRFLVLRIYWDGEENPSVEVPLGDFFACGLNEFSLVNSIPVCVNPGSAFNCYWEMPFRKSCKITVENLNPEEITLFYQIDYSLTEIEEDAAYFHAQFRRQNPLPYKKDYVVVDQIKGWGHFVGMYMLWGVNNNGWWGEGEVKFFMDGDDKFPTICGTGTEDYFCGSYDFENREEKKYVYFSTPYAGLVQITKPDGLYKSQQRFGMYRWHIMDPVRFEKDLRVTVQALSWRSDGRYLPLQDDISSVAFWYQSEPHNKFPELPDKDFLEII
ncbi:MAG: DUF2961 domain-containing protein [Melioribacteraceae bacterium]|nr:DUF2961 domain-containing protein [Melioribacteraceae bacterium]MCF8354706.1 DUF2961 domain-containing protein [Melioribacteraceae bacterium]MCF8393161.1 DUF2961 domain-containing protein [Melioribacteraceae bacterium]MCF8418064.1 DUF2961 domain-containing protein [Melioribacteraceae bacterium]